MQLIRVVLAAVHSVVHIALYAVPRALMYTLVKLPLTFIESSIGDQITFSTSDFDIEIVGNWWDKTTVTLFGLVEEGLQYPSPLYNGHIQTILGAARQAPHVAYERVYIKGEDGCVVCADWSLAKVPLCKGVLLVLPGTSSTSKSPYIRDFVADATRDGFTCAVLNPRGMGDTPPATTPVLNTGVFTSDLRSALRDNLIVSSAVEAGVISDASLPLIAVGFSLGGSILCNYLAQEGERKAAATGGAENLAAAVSICAPWDMHLVNGALSRPLGHLLYQGPLTGGLRSYFLKHRSLLETLPEFDGSLLFEPAMLKATIRTVADYDALITAPLNGFSSREAYYTAASSILKLHHCPVPLLCIGAKDDPVCPPPALRRWEHVAQENKNVLFMLLPAGGHLGFVGNPMEEVFHVPCVMHRTVLHSASSVVESLKRTAE